MTVLKKIAGTFARAALVCVGFVASVWLALAVFGLVHYREFRAERLEEQRIPALHNGFVPQGLSVTEDGIALHSGYHAKTGALELYIDQDGTPRRLIPLREDGTPIKGHGGGISIAKDYVYLADKGCVTVFALADLLSASENGSVKALRVVEVDTSASFCFADDKNLYVGEYFRAGNYELDESHAFVTPSGERNRAIVTVYPLDEDGALASDAPAFAISVPHQVQGFAVDGDVYITSSSWGLADSELSFYNGLCESDATFPAACGALPLYYLASENLAKTVRMPAFSEGLDIANGRVYITFESACNKYIVGKLFFANRVLSYPIEQQ